MKKILAGFTTALLAVGLAVVGIVAPASAHTPTASLTCTSASVNLAAYDSGATALITLDGTPVHTGTFGGAYNYSQTFNPAANHTLVVTVVSQDGSQYNYNFSKTTSNCGPPAPTTRNVPVESVDCATDVTITTTYYKTPFVFNSTTQQWVAGAEVQDGPPVVTHRALTDAEKDKCAGDEPPAQTRNVPVESVDCATDVTITTTYYKTPFVFNSTTHQWVSGVEVQDGPPVVTHRALTDAEKDNCAGPQPPSLHRNVPVESLDCATDVTITTTYFTTPFVFNSTTHQWVAGTEVQDGNPIVTHRVLTDAEKDVCAGPQPPSQNRFTAVETLDCETDVTITTTHYSTPFVLDTVLHEWVAGTEVQDGLPVITHRVLTDAEKDVCAGPQPPSQNRETQTELLDCDTDVTITTTHFTTPFVFDATLHEWIAGTEVQDGQPVVTHRDATPAELEECEPPTLPSVEATVTQLQNCTTSTYTLSSDDSEAVIWTVNGESSEDGTFEAEADSTVVITATAAEGYGFSGLETNEQDWSLEFAAEEDCLPTLALTGGTASLGLMLAGGMLFLGMAGIYARRRYGVRAQ